MNIGEKMLFNPRLLHKAIEIYKIFGLKYFDGDIEPINDTTIFNAQRLVELNNEVYEKLNPEINYQLEIHKASRG